MKQHIEHNPPVQVAPGVFHMSTTHEGPDELVSDERVMLTLFILGFVLGVAFTMFLS